MNNSHATRPELELLMLSVRPMVADVEDRVRALLHGRIEWTELVEWALWHHVTPLLHRTFTAIPDAAVPDEIRRALQVNVEGIAARAARCTESLLDVLERMESEGIDALAYKGPVLARDAYPDPALRVFRDVDVLVRHADIARATALLEARGFSGRPDFNPAQQRGFREQAGQLQLSRDDGVIVEVHWDLVQPVFSVNLDQAGMWNRSRVIEVAGRSVRTFSPEDTLTYLCVHGGKEQWTRLKWVADVAFLLERYPSLDVDRVCDEARRRGYLRMVWLGLALAHRFLGASLPPSMRSRIARDRSVPRLLGRVHEFVTRTRLEDPDSWSLSAFRWRMRERWRDRLRYAARTVLTPRMMHYALVPLPNRMFWGYGLVRVVFDYVLSPPWRWVKRVGRRR